MQETYLWTVYCLINYVIKEAALFIRQTNDIVVNKAFCFAVSALFSDLQCTQARTEYIEVTKDR